MASKSKTVDLRWNDRTGGGKDKWLGTNKIVI